jgi:hypothetical protein
MKMVTILLILLCIAFSLMSGCFGFFGFSFLTESGFQSVGGMLLFCCVVLAGLAYLAGSAVYRRINQTSGPDSGRSDG